MTPRPPTSTLFPYTTLFRSALGVARDELQRFFADRNLFLVDNQPKLTGDRLRADRPELVHLRSGEHCFRDLLELGRRHHENDVRRRLLDGLEQRVERRGRALMALVD